MSHHFDPTILRAYDIRGQVGSTLHPEDAFAIGRSFGAHIHRQKERPRIAVGRDGRLTSPLLSQHLIDGLVASGCHVIDIGTGPTPMLYFADRILECDGAIQVTGSHNPKDFNGFKIVRNHQSFFGDDIQMLGDIASKELPAASAAGISEVQDILPEYVSVLRKEACFQGLTLVWDCGNGACGPALNALLEGAEGHHTALYTEVDGNFPNHHPNPVDPETLESLRQHVFEADADCGIGFDGDGDRIGVIDAKGRQVAGDILTAYLADDILSRKPASEILFDVKSSAAAMDIVRMSGGNPSLWKTGHSHMKKRLKDVGAPLAGEMSGHIFISDGYYGFDDALFVAARLSGLLSRAKDKRDLSLTEFVDQLPPSFATPECRIACDDNVKFSVMDTLSQQMSATFRSDQLNLLDGVRLTTEQGWCLIRPSNTEGALIARAEGRSEDALDDMVTLLSDQLASVGIIWDGR